MWEDVRQAEATRNREQQRWSRATVCAGALPPDVLMSVMGSKRARRGEFGFRITCTSGSSNDRHVERVYLRPNITTGFVFAGETHVTQAKRSDQQPGAHVELQPNESMRHVGGANNTRRH